MAEPSGSGAKTGIPVFVMLPLHILNGQTNKVNYGRRPSPAVGLDERYDKLKTLPEKVLLADLDSLKKAKVQGVMVDCWWGIVEAEGPGQYNWDGYKNLFSIVKAADLELHVVMSFHACVENGVETIPLPGWVKSIGEDKDLFYKDAHGNPSTEYLSGAVDNERVFKDDQSGNQLSPLQVYENFMNGFNTNVVDYFDKQDEKGIITMIEVGLGPCGELRYPAYRLPWNFVPTPGVGGFQCYDKYMMESWKNEAEEQGFTIPCCVGPQTAGDYTSTPEQTQFFQTGTGLTNGICYDGTYGKTFLTWYSKNLVDHGERVLKIASEIFNPKGIKIAAKVPGIHWWYGIGSHPAEATAGLFTGVPDSLSVYKSIAVTLKDLGATFIFTCAEMRDNEQKNANAFCEPELLVKQVLQVVRDSEVPIACENALSRYDEEAFQRIQQVAAANEIDYFTYLRLDGVLMTEPNFENFKTFVSNMKALPITSPQGESTS
ncbi:hypothetical protein CY35_10G005800 [Sphagnum magellanicum]|nr:hypothetical protein CY35_10G005800 [Sphagnum magellanicum]KAH9549176.1 hypothetical protein CY35_10G005800 [Sphagnum magellanicum]